MPADEHELMLALEEGVVLKELLAPVKIEDGVLICKKTLLGRPDASGRAGVILTEEVERIPADTVIAAVGEKVPADFYEANGIHVDDRGCAKVSADLETNLEGVYVIGDGLYGPSLVVKGMANAKKAAEAIAGTKLSRDLSRLSNKADIYAKKGILAEPLTKEESQRCLSCSTVCENCVDVCPNRANISVKVPGMDKEQVIHVDYMCNECGNCKSFCPYASAPYLDKFTLFASEADMKDSQNDGFAIIDRKSVSCKVRYLGEMTDWSKDNGGTLPEGIGKLMEAVCKDYVYLDLLDQ